MNTHVSSPPVPRGVPRLLGHKVAVAIAAGGLLVAGVIGAGVYATSRDDSSVPPVVSAPAPQVIEAVPVAASTARMNHVYLVASDEQAALVASGITEANDILATWGTPPFTDSVVVAPSDLLAAELLGAVEEANRLAAGLGGAHSLVVDLR